jgi:integrase
MSESVGESAPASLVVTFPTPPNRDSLTVRQLADAYMAHYVGLDSGRPARVKWWCERIGDLRVVDLDSDLIADYLDAYAAGRREKYMGRDPRGQPILKSLGPRKPATINRAKSALGALLTFAKQRRLTPRGWPNPIRDVPGRREDNARTRFLSSEEQARLLSAARICSWPRLHLLVLMGITTGARKGELLSLRGGDLHLERGRAHLRATKNGSQRVLRLVPDVVMEIRRLGAPKGEALLFPSTRKPLQPMDFSNHFLRALRDARIEGASFHTLRPTHASILAMNGASLVEIADSMGHRTMEMVRRYAHLAVDHKVALIDRVFAGDRNWAS